MTELVWIIGMCIAFGVIPATWGAVREWRNTNDEQDWRDEL